MLKRKAPGREENIRGFGEWLHDPPHNSPFPSKPSPFGKRAHRKDSTTTCGERAGSKEMRELMPLPTARLIGGGVGGGRKRLTKQTALATRRGS